MEISGLIVQVLNGFAEASSLFMIAAGLSIIFGVTRIVNFAHGSFFMIGAYVAYATVEYFGDPLWFWPSIVVAGLAASLVGLIVELTLLRRIYRAPELTQLLATYAVMLIVQDLVLYLFGPVPLLGPRAPGFQGAIAIFDRQFPTYSLFLIVAGPVTLGILWLLVTRTRWGRLVRAATQDRQMVSALGINQAWLFTSIFVLGTFVAGVGGAIQIPREPASLDMDVHAITSAFVVVVVGGLGSLPGAFFAAILVAQVKALCLWIGIVEIGSITFSLSKFTIAVEFVVMAVVLMFRPYGLMGTKPLLLRHTRNLSAILISPLKTQGWVLAALILAVIVVIPQMRSIFPYMPILTMEIIIMMMFASSLQFLMGSGGMHSFGHAAYFGLGAYGAAIVVGYWNLPLELALVVGIGGALAGAIILGWFSVRLTGVYLAMLTLAFAQIVWAIFYQFEGLAGGENGITGVWPDGLFEGRDSFYYLTVACLVISMGFLYRVLFSPFGYALRGARDSVLRAESIGMNVKLIQWQSFVLAAIVAGLAGALYALSKGSVSPEMLSASRSIEALVMVVLGGEYAIGGGILGSAAFVWLRDFIGYNADYWRGVLGIITIVLLLALPQGLASLPRLADKLRRTKI